MGIILRTTIRVAKLAIELIVPLIMPQAKSEPVAVPGWCTIGPTPPAFLMDHTKNATPATGTKYAFTVNRILI